MARLSIEAISCPVQHYDWGSPSAIPALLGVEPDGRPWAELWIGAHPAAPSQVERPGGPVPLNALIEADPLSMLGPARLEHGDELPFLMKVLAAAAPLSLQVHPTKIQARAGFDREEQAGIDRTSPTRTYRDPNHKPELVCALTPFTALCGFRAPETSAALLASLDVAELAPLVDLLHHAGDDLGPALTWLFDLHHDEARRLARAIAVAASRPAAPFELERAWAARIAERYPGDVGIVVALLLNLVELRPGEALFLDGGTLHAYLEGTAIEVMANSDNVIRGGLTTKHIDVPELLAVTRAAVRPVDVITPHVVDGEAIYDSPAAEFTLSSISLDERGLVRSPRGPELILCTAGSARLTVDGRTLALEAGEACFIPGSSGPVALEGPGHIHRTTVGRSHLDERA